MIEYGCIEYTSLIIFCHILVRMKGWLHPTMHDISLDNIRTDMSVYFLTYFQPFFIRYHNLKKIRLWVLS